MSNERYGDTDLIYWMGKSINAMTREELQVALGESIMQIERLKECKQFYYHKSLQHYNNYMILKESIDEKHSYRFANPDYIASFV